MGKTKEVDTVIFERYLTDVNEIELIFTKEKDEEIKKLKEENLTLSVKVANKKKYNARKSIELKKDVINTFIEYFEEGLNSKRINHFKLKKQIEKHLKNQSDVAVLYFILQQTILYKRGMAILTEKQIKEGIKTKYKTWTEGTERSEKTIAESLKFLEAQGIIFRHRHNKLKSVFFINTSLSREIFKMLEDKECDFQDIQHFINVEMNIKKKLFSTFPVKSGNIPDSTGKHSGLNEETFHVKHVNSPDYENAMLLRMKAFHQLSTMHINNGINVKDLNNKQTKQVDLKRSKIEKKPNFNPANQNELVTEKHTLEKLFSVWKVTKQFTESMTGRENPSLYDLKEALKMKISMYADDFINKDKPDDEFIANKHKFFKKLDETIKNLNIELTQENMRNILNVILDSIDKLTQGSSHE